MGEINEIKNDSNESELKNEKITFFSKSIVLEDPAGSKFPKRIPGAVIKFIYHISNDTDKNLKGIVIDTSNIDNDKFIIIDSEKYKNKDFKVEYKNGVLNIKFIGEQIIKAKENKTYELYLKLK